MDMPDNPLAAVADPQVLEVMGNLQVLARAGGEIAKKLNSQLLIEQSALTSRSVELVETVLSDKQVLLDELSVIEKRINEIFSYLNVYSRQRGRTTRGYIRENFTQVDRELNQFIECISECRIKGMENDGLLNFQLVQISSSIAMLSPQNSNCGDPVYTPEKQRGDQSISTASWVA